MIRRLLREGCAWLRGKLTLSRCGHTTSDTEADGWLRQKRAEFKKKVILKPKSKIDVRYNPLAVDEEINCPCHYGAPSCILHPREGDPSEELAFLKWLADEGLKPPKRNVLRNDGVWRPLSNDDHFYMRPSW